MTLAAEIEKLQKDPGVTGDFGRQLEEMRKLGEQQGAGSPTTTGHQSGVDRSRDLTPIARPTIVRTLVG